VAPYRLAIHLTLACLILAATAWTALTLDRPRGASTAGTVTSALLVVAVLIQIFLGALVAGNDAGLVYNTWPDMNGTLVPPDILAMDPIWRNFFENRATVQFVHRLGAYTVFVLAVLEGLGSIVRAQAGDRQGKKTAIAVLLVAAAQAGIGIATLLYVVPLHLALAHQAGAVVLLVTALMHRAAVTKTG
jgi:heme a synthase